jgi:D-glucuronyl C5-epimerase C-terminus
LRYRLLAVLSTAAALTILPPGAQAAPVTVLGHGNRPTVRDDRFLTTPADFMPPAHLVGAPRLAHASRRPARPCGVCVALRRLARTGAIPVSAYRHYRMIYAAARAALRRLAGTRAAELGAVIDNVRQIAAAGLLRPSRLPALFETIDRNRQWWTTGPLLAQYQRVEFSGSQLVWEYYPGQGIELQILANFSKADGLYTAGTAQYPTLRALLDELTALAVQRAGGLAWEYYFQFDGGTPPWISAMAQGTALEAFTRAYRAFGDRSYLDVAHRALAVLRVRPPVGVGVPTALGTRYVQYSFAPSANILNAFLQTLIGLYDYARASRDPLARALFAAGDAEARAEVPRYDTGAWSLYQPGLEDTLSYHLLVTTFLQELCSRTGAAVYCRTAKHFAAYLKTGPSLTLLTARVRRRTPGLIRFRLSKYSHVGIVLVLGQRTLLATSAYFGYGIGGFAVPALAPGNYTVRLAATDLAGNFSRITGTVAVPAAPPRRKHSSAGAR